MTPMELRKKAVKNLEDSKTLVEKSPDNAHYLAGYAVEYMLKARLLRHRGWSRLPRSMKELAEWNSQSGRPRNEKVFIHDLNELLSLAGDSSIKSTEYGHINWELVCQWSEQKRYAPIDSITGSDSTEHLAEV